LFFPAIFCLLLGLQWGGTKYPWGDARIVALLETAGVLVIAFIAVQIWRKEDATIPPRIAKQRSIACGMVFTTCIGGGMIAMMVTISLWFQAVKGRTAVQAGIDTIPIVLALVIGSMLAGALVQKIGYYVPWMLASAVLASTGSGLITTFDSHTGHAKWIGYQVLFGLGLGTGLQQGNLAAQTVLEKRDVPTGISLMFFSQSFGGAIFVCISQSLFTNRLASGLDSIAGVDAGVVVKAGATELARLVPADKITEVLVIYNDALVRAFWVVVAGSCLLILPALGMEWRSIKEADPSKPGP
jgi:hypothetical protein